jgi:uncharacterized protein YceH (UPF0502 family)
MVRPPEEVPMLRRLMETLGDQFVEAPKQGFGVAMMSERAAATVAPDDRIAQLEEQITHLRERIDKLTPGAPA